MNCEYCNALLPPDAKICAQCGASVAPASSRKHVSIPEELAKRAVGFVGRSWVLDKVVEWMGSKSERFLLITGEPGSGKTALAAWLAGGTSSENSSADVKLEGVRDAW